MCRADYSVVMVPFRPRLIVVVGLFGALNVLAGCKAEPARTYPLRGQILAFGDHGRPDGRRDVTVKHEDIPNFMPAMTMAYSVNQPHSLDGLQPGDLVTATLVLHPGSG